MKPINYFLQASVLLLYSATSFSDDIEVVEVLAPKKSISVSGNSLTSSFVDKRYTYTAKRTVADQLISLPGVSLNGQGGQFQSYSIRGFSRHRIRTEVDGIPIITDRRAGNSSSFIAPELISSGQVVKGPSSVIYGSQALGGVVNLSSSVDSSSFSTSTSLPNNGANIALKHAGDNFSFGLAYQQADNDKAPTGDGLNTQFERFSGVFKYQTQWDDLALNFSMLPSLGKNIGKSNVKYPEQEISDYPEEVHNLTQFQVSQPDNWFAKVFHHYQNWDSATNRVGEYESLTAYQSHTIGGQFLSKVQTESLDAVVGVDWLAREGVKIDSKYELLESDLELSNQFTANQVAGDEDNIAIYGKNRWQLDGVSFELGVRYDWLEQTSQQNSSFTDDEVSVSLALEMPMTNAIKAQFDLGSGFRFPTLSERYFNGRTPRGFIQGNEELKAETSIGSQLAILFEMNPTLSITSALYHYELDDYIERYRINDDLLSYRNLSSAKISGLELGAKWHVSDYIEHHFGYQKQKGEDAQNQVLADLHPEQVNLTTLISFDKLMVANSFKYQFETDRVSDSEIGRDDALIWDVSVDYQLNDTQNIKISVNNLGDQKYYGSLDEDAALQPERMVKLFFDWHY